MYSPREKLPVPSDFGLPYAEVYDIQKKLMASLFTVLEEKKIGIFESPTGTGKSLTLTCASLCWLEQHEALVRQELQARISVAKEELNKLEAESMRSNDWLRIQQQVIEQRDDLKSLQKLKELLDAEEKRHELRQQNKGKKWQRKQSICSDDISSLDSDAKFDIDEHQKLEGGAFDAEETSINVKEKERYRSVQIFFCSRTHSQLAQVLREVKRTRYGQRMRCVSLASRQQLCVNPQVRCLSNVAAINERCVDMARHNKSVSTLTDANENGSVIKKSKTNSTATITKCPYKTTTAVQELSEWSLCNVKDIEELVSEGQSMKACAYYAAREAVQSAQLVMLPYQLLLHRASRLQSGIDLRGAVVIIDEAHNLLDTIAQIHSCELTLSELILWQQQVLAYKQQYATRFSTSNLLRINQLLFINNRLIDFLQPSASSTFKTGARMLRTYELSAEGEFYNIDLRQVLQFCDHTRFAQKLQGHAQCEQRRILRSPLESKLPSVQRGKTATVNLLQQLQQQQNDKNKNDNEESASVSSSRPNAQLIVSIRPLLTFLEALTENADDGRVLVNVETASLKYLLLNPGNRFADIVREARAIVIAGGTMQPTDELTHQLFHTSLERVTQHFYDHVVPVDAVLPLVVTRGPTGQQLCFNFAQRNSEAMISELGRCLINFCNVIPAGVICFLPSYDYLETVYAQLQTSGLLAHLTAKKCVFYESKKMHNVEKLLTDYESAIKRNVGGALLLSVVGGKLSEGLNFADDLGRGVIVVGLPYPNRKSPELLERLNYLDSILGAGASNEHYENLCMKAVNQCIGRSVRHIADYACVCLLDERYATVEHIRHKLPQWIKRSLQSMSLGQKFGSINYSIAKFFQQKSK